MSRGLGGALLGAALFVVVGWPALATTLAASRGAEAPGGGGLIDRAWGSGVGRPLDLLRNTALLVAGTEAVALPIGLPLAVLLFRTDLWGRRVVLGLLALAAFVPMPLHATAWLGAFGNAGRSQVIGSAPILTGLPGAAVVHAMAALPWVVLIAGVGLRTVEAELEESALIDLPAWRVLATVTLRRALGAVVAAALAVAVLTAGDMTVTDILRIRTYAEEAYVQFQVGNGPESAAVVALPPLALLGGAVLVASRALLRLDPARLPSAEARVRLWRLGRWRVPLGVAVALTAGNLAALPIYGLAWRAGRVGGDAALGIPPHWSPTGLVGTLGSAWEDVEGPLLKSALWAAVAASATVSLAWPLAWAARRPGPWRWAVAATVALTLATPGPIEGMALVLSYNAAPPGLSAPLLPWAVFLLRSSIYDTTAIVVLAYVVRTLPYAVLVLWPSVRTVPTAHLEAAALDGYGPTGQALRVAWPLTRGATVAAWGVAFVLALGELPAVNLVEPPSRTMLLATLVWGLLHTGVESHLAGVGLVLLGAIGAAGVGAAWALGRLYGPRESSMKESPGVNEFPR